MRKMLTVVLALLLSAGVAGAAAIGDTGHQQGQTTGGISGVIPATAAGGIGGAAAYQADYGFSVATQPGDLVTSTISVDQPQSSSTTSADGAGTTFFYTASASNQVGQVDTSAGNGGQAGAAGAGQLQAGFIGAAGFTVGGTDGVAGSAGAAGGLAASGVIGVGDASTTQNQGFANVYQQQSVHPNGGYVYQEGASTIITVQNTSASSGAGLAFSSAGAAQVGGSVVSQDGQGTFSQGRVSGVSTSSAGTAAFGTGAADAGASATQIHAYNMYNVSADGNSSQTATGSVTTTSVSTASSP